MIINLELTWDRIQLYLQNCLQQVSCIWSTFTYHFSVSGERCTHSKDLFYTRFMLVLQNAVLVLLYLAGAMDAACGCAINNHTDIWLFNYSTTYPSNILIVSSLYRFDFSLFYGIFFEIWMLILCLNILFYHGPINKPLHFAEVKIIQLVWLAHLAPQNEVVRFAGMKYINVWLACLAL